MGLNTDNGLGKTTTRDAIKAKLRNSGVSNAAGALVTYENGDTVLIVSDDNPNMARTDAIRSIEVKQSARAGSDLTFGERNFEAAE
jgi:hypothetical protein